MTTTFFTACNQPYWPFVAPYAASVLLHNDDALVEIAVEDVPTFQREHEAAVTAITEHFPDRFHVRGGVFTDVRPGAVRFLETPEWLSEYTYIGDADILVLEGGIAAQHLAKMDQTGLPYSNIVRPGTKRLSGLHFTRSDAYYPVVTPEGWNVLGSDEETLYAVVTERGLPLPADDARWRPAHGLHLSLQRRPVDSTRPAWGLHPRWVDPYLALWQHEAWLAVADGFHPAYQMLLAVLEAAMQAQYPEREIYRYRDVERLWRHLATPPRAAY